MRRFRSVWAFRIRGRLCLQGSEFFTGFHDLNKVLCLLFNHMHILSSFKLKTNQMYLPLAISKRYRRKE
jgi:hypothetical protein